MSVLTVPKQAISANAIEQIERMDISAEERELLLAIAEKQNRGPLVVFAEEDYLSPNQCAKTLGVSRAHFNKILDAGELPFQTVGSRDRRIKSSDLADYLRGVEKTRKIIAKNAANPEDVFFGLLDEM